MISRLLAGHEPWFAVAVDHRWNILLANGPAEALLRSFYEEGEVPGPRNLLRPTQHPAGLRSTILNLDAVEGRILASLEREMAVRPGDSDLVKLRDEVASFRGAGGEATGAGARVPTRLQTDCGEARLVTVLMSFDDPLGPVAEEVRIETLLPQDAESEAVLMEAFSRLTGGGA